MTCYQNFQDHYINDQVGVCLVNALAIRQIWHHASPARLVFQTLMTMFEIELKPIKDMKCISIGKKVNVGQLAANPYQRPHRAKFDN